MELVGLHKSKENLDSCPKVTLAQAEITSEGKVVLACASLENKVYEWQSLALVGKFALESQQNIERGSYSVDHPDEVSLGLAVLHK